MWALPVLWPVWCVLPWNCCRWTQFVRDVLHFTRRWVLRDCETPDSAPRTIGQWSLRLRLYPLVVNSHKYVPPNLLLITVSIEQTEFVLEQFIPIIHIICANLQIARVLQFQGDFRLHNWTSLKQHSCSTVDRWWALVNHMACTQLWCQLFITRIRLCKRELIWSMVLGMQGKKKNTTVQRRVIYPISFGWGPRVKFIR